MNLTTLRRHHGYILLDLVTGLAILGMSAVALSRVAVWQNRGQSQLAQSRMATAAAEDALTRLQRGQPPQPAPDVTLTARPLDGPDARPVGGRVWIEVIAATRDQRKASLTGLVPASAIPLLPTEARP